MVSCLRLPFPKGSMYPHKFRGLGFRVIWALEYHAFILFS